MSSIAGIAGFGTSGMDMAQLLQLQQLKGSGGGMAGMRAGGMRGMGGFPGMQGGGPGEAMKAEFEAKFESAAEAAGLDEEGTADLMEQIRAAITAAREEQGAASNPREGRQAVKDAVRSVLEENDLDADAFEEAMAPPKMGSMFSQLGMLEEDDGDGISQLLSRFSSLNVLA